MLKINDIPGGLTVQQMREQFEADIRNSRHFAANTPLAPMEVNGVFSHYLNPETDTMWLGYALGLHRAAKNARQQAPVANNQIVEQQA